MTELFYIAETNFPQILVLIVYADPINNHEVYGIIDNKIQNPSQGPARGDPCPVFPIWIYGNNKVLEWFIPESLRANQKHLIIRHYQGDIKRFISK